MSLELVEVTGLIVYASIMLLAAILFLVLGIAIYKGNTKLIHDYHQTHIKESERLDYGRAFAKGMFVICAALFISGIMAFFGAGALAASLMVLTAGTIVSIIMLVRVQKKFNGGVF